MVMMDGHQVIDGMGLHRTSNHTHAITFVYPPLSIPTAQTRDLGSEFDAFPLSTSTLPF